jgi:WD40 repeat protein
VLGRQRNRIKTKFDSICSLAFSPDGKTIAVSGGIEDWKPPPNEDQLYRPEMVKLWDVETGRELRVLTGFKGWVRLSFAANVKVLLTANNKRIQLWSVETGKEIAGLEANDDWIECVAISPDGNLLAAGHRFTDTVELWDMMTHKEICRFPGHRGWVHFLAFLHDGKTLVSSGADNTVKFWTVAKLRELKPKGSE